MNAIWEEARGSGSIISTSPLKALGAHNGTFSALASSMMILPRVFFAIVYSLRSENGKIIKPARVSVSMNIFSNFNSMFLCV
jgi:hypothetical protein